MDFAAEQLSSPSNSYQQAPEPDATKQGSQVLIPVIKEFDSLLVFVKKNLPIHFAEDLNGTLLLPPFFCPNKLADKAVTIQHEQETKSPGQHINLEGLLAEQAVYYALQYILPKIYRSCAVIQGFDITKNNFIFSFLKIDQSTIQIMFGKSKEKEIDFIIIVPSKIKSNNEIRIILLEVKRSSRQKHHADEQLKTGKKIMSKLVKELFQCQCLSPEDQMQKRYTKIQIEGFYFSPNEETEFHSSDPNYANLELLEEKLKNIVAGEIDRNRETIISIKENIYENLIYALIAIDSIRMKKCESDTNFDKQSGDFVMTNAIPEEKLIFSRIKISRKAACENLCSTLHRQAYLKTFVRKYKEKNTWKPQRFVEVDSLMQELPISPKLIKFFVDVLTEQQVEVLKDFDRRIIEITGFYGTGKTILMLMIALQEIEHIFTNTSKYNKVVFLANDGLLNNYIKPKVEDAIGMRNYVDNWKKVEFWDDRRVFNELQTLAQSKNTDLAIGVIIAITLCSLIIPVHVAVAICCVVCFIVKKDKERKKSLGAAVQKKFQNQRFFIDELSSAEQLTFVAGYNAYPAESRDIFLHTLFMANDVFSNVGICWCSNDEVMPFSIHKRQKLSTPLRYTSIQLDHAIRDNKSIFANPAVPFGGFGEGKLKPCLMFGNRTRVYNLGGPFVGNAMKCLDKEIRYYTKDFVQPEDLLIIVQSRLLLFNLIKRHVQVCVNGSASCREDGSRRAHTGITVVNALSDDDASKIGGLEFKATIAILQDPSDKYQQTSLGLSPLLFRRYFAHTLITGKLDRSHTYPKKLGNWFFEVCALAKHEQNSALHCSCKDLVDWPHGLRDAIIQSSERSDIHQLRFSKAEIELTYSIRPELLHEHPASNARVPLSLIMAPAHPFHTFIEVCPTFPNFREEEQQHRILLRKGWLNDKPCLEAVLTSTPDAKRRFGHDFSLSVKYETGNQALQTVEIYHHAFKDICSFQKMEEVLCRNENITFEVSATKKTIFEL